MVEFVYYCCEFLYTAVKVWFTLRLAEALWEPKREDKVQYAVWAAAVAVISGLNTWNIRLILMPYSKVVMEAWVFLLAWVSLILYRCRYRDAFCLIYLLWNTLALVDFFLQALIYTGLQFLGFQSEVLLVETMSRAVYQFLWAVFLLWAVKPICRFGRQESGRIVRTLKWDWLLVLPLLVCVIYFQRIYPLMALEGLMLRWWLFWLGCLLFLLVLSVYLVFQRDKRNYQALQLRTEMIEKEYRNLQQEQEERRVLQHDLEKHIQAAREMVGAGRGQDALDYLDEMSAELQKGRNRNLANHDLINLILNTKEREAQVSGIPVQYETEDMGGLQLKPMEIVAMFTNILDNAIEANQTLGEGVQRWISFSCLRKGQMLVISASNAWVGGRLKFDGEIPRTTKADKRNHGIGMQSIRQVAERHEGHMKIRVGEDRFSLTVYLKGFPPEDTALRG